MEEKELFANLFEWLAKEMKNIDDIVTPFTHVRMLELATKEGYSKDKAPPMERVIKLYVMAAADTLLVNKLGSKIRKVLDIVFDDFITAKVMEGLTKGADKEKLKAEVDEYLSKIKDSNERLGEVASLF